MAFKKKAVVEQTKVQETVAEVVKLTPELAARRLSNTQLEIQSQLSKVHGQYLKEFEELQKVTLAKEAKAAELKALHDIEETAGVLDGLHEKIEGTRAAWTKEVEERDQAREREAEQFEYELAQKRKKDNQQYAEARAAQDKVHADRDAALKLREANLKELEAKVAGHEAAIDAAVKKAEAVLGNTIKKHYENEAKLTSLQVSAEKGVLLSELAAAKALIEHVKLENADLKVKHSQALQDVKELSGRVTDAMASRETVQNLQKAIETMQPQRSGK